MNCDWNGRQPMGDEQTLISVMPGKEQIEHKHAHADSVIRERADSGLAE